MYLFVTNPALYRVDAGNMRRWILWDTSTKVDYYLFWG